MAFQPRRQIDAVAEHRIIEPQVGPHIADDACAGIKADTDIERDVSVAALLRLDLTLLVKRFDSLQHVDRGLACIELVPVVVQRRIPERHDRVAHVFVDGALALDDGVGERSEKAIHQVSEAVGIVFVMLRNRSKAAYVGE